VGGRTRAPKSTNSRIAAIPATATWGRVSFGRLSLGTVRKGVPMASDNDLPRDRVEIKDRRGGDRRRGTNALEDA
jgi:hypothetical protein